jgi:putative transposase
LKFNQPKATAEQGLKNSVLLEQHHDLTDQFEESLGDFVEYYNHQYQNESFSNVTTADMYFGRGESTIKERKKE